MQVQLNFCRVCFRVMWGGDRLSESSVIPAITLVQDSCQYFLRLYLVGCYTHATVSLPMKKALRRSSTVSRIEFFFDCFQLPYKRCCFNIAGSWFRYVLCLQSVGCSRIRNHAPRHLHCCSVRGLLARRHVLLLWCQSTLSSCRRILHRTGASIHLRWFWSQFSSCRKILVWVWFV